MGIISLVLRIIFTVWVVNIAKRQNRPETQWGFSGFIFPSFTLIIIGLSKKLNKDLQNDQIPNTTDYNQQEFVDKIDKKTFVVQTLNHETIKEQQARMNIEVEKPTIDEYPNGYRIASKNEGWSLSTGKYTEYLIEFPDKETGRIIYNSKKDQFCYTKNDSVEYFDGLDNCIESLKEYKTTDNN